MTAEHSHFGLSAKLLLLLLAFGVVPVGLSITVGYSTSRALITEGSERALRELAARQAVQLATELTRQQLLLRTITGQLAESAERGAELDGRMARQLMGSLPEDGVFDGLRVVTEDGRVLVAASLRTMAAQWPQHAPATAWARDSLVVHRDGDRVIAYLISHPVGAPGSGLWLEGHVRAEDFRRLFSLPAHLAGAIEPAIFEATGEVLVVGHEHARSGLVEAFALDHGDTLTVTRAKVEGRPAVVATAPLAGWDLYFTAALPLEIALAPLSRLRDTAAVSTAILFVLLVFTAPVAARSVTTPLRKLADAARHFGTEGTYHKLQLRGRDEVSLLVAAFNRMVDDLERSREEIERLHARELERAEQLATVGELASGVAHEIRNPVTGVRGALELAMRDLPEESASLPLLEEADLQLERIETTTSQLLNYARPPDLREVVVDANTLVDRAVHVVEARARAAGIELEVAPSRVVLLVRVDPELMVQVLVNLLFNGIDAMPEGGPLSIAVSGENSQVCISVRDSGPGIPEDLRLNIFRPFFTTKHKGTGLGLSISQQVVNRHGGAIHVEDTPGGGATFVVELPLNAEENLATQ